MMEIRELGRRGEDFAAGLYEDQGMRVIARNVRYDCGELDLVARAPDGTYVFVEVKTRSSRRAGGAESVTARKVMRMRRAAARWLADKPYGPTRFDVVELIVEGSSFSTSIYEGVDEGAS